MRQQVGNARGSIGVLVERPISLAILLVIIAITVGAIVSAYKKGTSDV